MKISAGLNRKLVEVGNSHYAYKAYLLNLLNFGQEAKNTWIQSGCFYKDTSEQLDNIEIQATTNHKVNIHSNRFLMNNIGMYLI